MVKCFGWNKDTETNTTSKWTMKNMEKAAEADIKVPEVMFTRPEFRPEWTTPYPPPPPPLPMDHTQDPLYPNIPGYESGISPEEKRYSDLRETKIMDMLDNLKTKYETE